MRGTMSEGSSTAGVNRGGGLFRANDPAAMPRDRSSRLLSVPKYARLDGSRRYRAVRTQRSRDSMWSLDNLQPHHLRSAGNTLLAVNQMRIQIDSGKSRLYHELHDYGQFCNDI